MKLYELADNYRNLVELLDDETIDPVVVLEAINQIEGDIIEKAQNIAKALINTHSEIESIKTEERRLAARRKALQGKYDGMKDWVGFNLKKAGIKKVGGIIPMTFRKCPPSVEIVDINKIPADYFIPQDPALDKKKILEVLKIGTDVQGVRLVDNKQYLKVG